MWGWVATYINAQQLVRAAARLIEALNCFWGIDPVAEIAHPGTPAVKLPGAELDGLPRGIGSRLGAFGRGRSSGILDTGGPRNSTNDTTCLVATAKLAAIKTAKDHPIGLV